MKLMLFSLLILAINYVSCKWVLDWAFDCTGISKTEIDARFRKEYANTVDHGTKMRRVYRWLKEQAVEPKQFKKRWFCANASIAPGFFFVTIVYFSLISDVLKKPLTILFVSLSIYCSVMFIIGIIYKKKSKVKHN